MPLFGDTCRDEGLYAVHVQAWSNISKSKFSRWQQKVSALLFGAALQAFGLGFVSNTFGTAQFLLICLHESCCWQFFFNGMK